MLTNILGKSGPGRVMNMDNLLLRESMDVIGRVGFEKEMGALEDFMEGDVGSGASVDVMLRCTHEARRSPVACGCPHALVSTLSQRCAEVMLRWMPEARLTGSLQRAVVATALVLWAHVVGTC